MVYLGCSYFFNKASSVIEDLYSWAGLDASLISEQWILKGYTGLRPVDGIAVYRGNSTPRSNGHKVKVLSQKTLYTRQSISTFCISVCWITLPNLTTTAQSKEHGRVDTGTSHCQSFYDVRWRTCRHFHIFNLFLFSELF